MWCRYGRCLLAAKHKTYFCRCRIKGPEIIDRTSSLFVVTPNIRLTSIRSPAAAAALAFRWLLPRTPIFKHTQTHIRQEGRLCVWNEQTKQMNKVANDDKLHAQILMRKCTEYGRVYVKLECVYWGYNSLAVARWLWLVWCFSQSPHNAIWFEFLDFIENFWSTILNFS